MHVAVGGGRRAAPSRTLSVLFFHNHMRGGRSRSGAIRISESHTQQQQRERKRERGSESAPLRSPRSANIASEPAAGENVNRARKVGARRISWSPNE
jgi:hypothetical protein